MVIATVTSKGQITIPVEVRRHLGLKAGSKLSFIPTGSGSYELVPATGSITALKGLISAPKIPITVEHMNQAIVDGATEGALR